MNYDNLFNYIYLIYRGSIFFTILLILHYVLVKFNFRSENTKYFLLHFLVNMYIVHLVWRDALETIWNPLDFKVAEIYPSFIAVLFHTYHLLFYNDIQRDEKLHHLVNVYVTSPLIWFNYNKVCNFALSIMMGLPGGITYGLLFLKDINAINPITEKNISASLNLWIRCPGAICVAGVIYIQMIYRTDIFNGLCFITGIVSIVGTYWNGIYFMQTIVESRVKCTIHEIKKKKLEDAQVGTSPINGGT